MKTPEYTYVLPCNHEKCLYNGVKRISFSTNIRSCCADKRAFPNGPPCPAECPERKKWSDAQDFNSMP